MKAARFRARPVEIEAYRLPAGAGMDVRKWPAWLRSAAREAAGGAPGSVQVAGDGRALEVRTPEGTMRAAPGDWIIRGLAGELYPCKPDLFAEKYEEVSG